MTPTRPLAGGHPTRFDFEAADVLDRNDTNRLDLVRRRSEKWVGGLTALTGLLGSVFIIKGPASLHDLPTPWRIPVGALLILALGTLTFSTYRAYQSAYGDPGRLDEIPRQPLTGLHERLSAARRHAAQAAQKHLRDAAAATLTAMVLITIAIGITWLAPTTTSDTRNICLFINGQAVAELPTGSTTRNPDTNSAIKPCP